MLRTLFSLTLAVLACLPGLALAQDTDSTAAHSQRIYETAFAAGSKSDGRITPSAMVDELNRVLGEDPAALAALEIAVKGWAETAFDLDQARAIAEAWLAVRPESNILPDLRASRIAGLLYAAPTADGKIQVRYRLTPADAESRGLSRVVVEMRSSRLPEEGDRVIEGRNFSVTMTPGDELIEEVFPGFPVEGAERVRIKLQFIAYDAAGQRMTDEFGRRLWWAFRTVRVRDGERRVPYQLAADGTKLTEGARMLSSAWSDLASLTETRALVTARLTRDEQLRRQFVGRPAPQLLLRPWPAQLTPRNALNTDGVHALAPGRVVVLDFWTDWCPPCRKAMPGLSRLYTENRDRGLEVIAVCDGTKPENYDGVQRFAEEKDLQQPMALAADATAANFDVQSWPMVFVIGRDGTVRGVWTTADEAAIEACVKQCLAEPL